MALYRHAGAELIESIKLVPSGKFFNLALAGGQTAQDFLAVLLNEFRDLATWEQVRFFFSDERAVPQSSERSNAGTARRTFISHLPLGDGHFFPMFEQGNAEEAALKYEDCLKRELPNAQGIPVFDLIYLGLGSDGHTASLFPGNLVVKQIVAGAPLLVAACQPSTAENSRITLCPRLINEAKNVVFMATGTAKKEAIHITTKGNYDPVAHPAQLVWQNRKKPTTFLCA